MAQVIGRHVTGRPRPPKLVARIEQRRIRVDDLNNPEFWLEIQLEDSDEGFDPEPSDITDDELEQLMGWAA